MGRQLFIPAPRLPLSAIGFGKKRGEGIEDSGGQGRPLSLRKRERLFSEYFK